MWHAKASRTHMWHTNASWNHTLYHTPNHEKRIEVATCRVYSTQMRHELMCHSWMSHELICDTQIRHCICHNCMSHELTCGRWMRHKLIYHKWMSHELNYLYYTPKHKKRIGVAARIGWSIWMCHGLISHTWRIHELIYYNLLHTKAQNENRSSHTHWIFDMNVSRTDISHLNDSRTHILQYITHQSTKWGSK